mgnify:CR=1 FL=1
MPIFVNSHKAFSVDPGLISDRGTQSRQRDMAVCTAIAASSDAFSQFVRESGDSCGIFAGCVSVDPGLISDRGTQSEGYACASSAFSALSSWAGASSAWRSPASSQPMRAKRDLLCSLRQRARLPISRGFSPHTAVQPAISRCLPHHPDASLLDPLF